MKKSLCFALSFVVVLAFAARASAADNHLTEQEKKDGWILLFNGEDYAGWKCNNGKEVASDIDDGCMQPYKSGGYVVTYDKPFGDFILKCEIKMPEQCNSGVATRARLKSKPASCPATK